MQPEEQKPPIVLLRSVVAEVMVPAFLPHTVQTLQLLSLGLVAQELEQWEPSGKVVGFLLAAG